MKFTYDSYRGLIHLLKDNNYSFCSYHNWDEVKKCVILRHDIDNDIEKALRFAELEKEEAVSSTYFVLLTSNFYNVFSSENQIRLNKIISLGHDIGLHFDEANYRIESIDSMRRIIMNEADLLSNAIGRQVKSVSMHRPSKSTLNADLKIQGLVNSYGKTYFNDFKYISDSRRRWREPVEEIITSKQFNRMHILTHAFWYNDVECTIQENVKKYVNSANIERYYNMKSNITDIDSIMSMEEVLYEQN